MGSPRDPTPGLMPGPDSAAWLTLPSFSRMCQPLGPKSLTTHGLDFKSFETTLGVFGPHPAVLRELYTMLPVRPKLALCRANISPCTISRTTCWNLTKAQSS